VDLMRNAPAGFARVPRSMPPGFTSGMKTRRTCCNSRCSDSSQSRRTTRLRNQAITTCVPMRSSPCTPPKKPTAGTEGDALPSAMR